jgi:hypothetical protein
MQVTVILWGDADSGRVDVYSISLMNAGHVFLVLCCQEDCVCDNLILFVCYSFDQLIKFT